jgi:cellulose biosynthesis protein BcsQ
MEVLRVPPYNLSVTLDVALATTEYEYAITDMADSSEITGEVTSNASSKVIIPLSSKYVDPNTKGTTASDIEAYRQSEELARAIIDSVCDVEFYYKKKVIETTGLGLDYIPIWVDAKKVLKVYENNVLVYDVDDLENSTFEFEITGDGSAIRTAYPDLINRNESKPIFYPGSPTDYLEFMFSERGFPRGWDYKIELEVGYHKVPSDIVKATELLVHDIDCGKLDYYKRYIGAYNTDQFRIQFDKAVFEGTGNLIVDKILNKYRKPIEFVGVL